MDNKESAGIGAFIIMGLIVWGTWKLFLYVSNNYIKYDGHTAQEWAQMYNSVSTCIHTYQAAWADPYAQLNPNPSLQYSYEPIYKYNQMLDTPQYIGTLAKDSPAFTKLTDSGWVYSGTFLSPTISPTQQIIGCLNK